MGAVDTTYTFTATDTITSAKMNNIIDQTTITSDAIIGTTLDVASGKLKVNGQGITSNELANGSVTQSKLAPNVAGGGPLIYATTSVLTSVATGATPVKITLNTVSPDTNNNFSTANSRFTPTVAGYYQINGYVNGTAFGLAAYISKNNTDRIAGSAVAVVTYQSVVSTILFCNGSTDYIELFATHDQGSTVSLTGGMNACLIRSA
jgi:hypothetical protein